MRDAGSENTSIDAPCIFAINVGPDVTIDDLNAIAKPNDITNAVIDASYEQQWPISKF